jgi:predicted metal-dependent peptidase
MSDDTKKPFNLNMHTARLLMREPFFAALSRRIDKIASTAVPTAGVRVNPDTAQFEMLYNPEFFEQLDDNHKLGILMHEFYHLVFEHVTKRKPAGGIKRIDNIAMDLSINCHISNMLPSDADPGPKVGDEAMKACIPGEGIFKDLPPFKTYEWYLEALKKMKEDQESGEGGEPGDGDPFGNADSLDSHDEFGDVDGTTQEIASERMKETIKKAAQEAEKARNWGSVSSSMRGDIMDRIATKIDWRKVLRYFVKTSRPSRQARAPSRQDCDQHRSIWICG